MIGCTSRLKWFHNFCCGEILNYCLGGEGGGGGGGGGGNGKILPVAIPFWCMDPQIMKKYIMKLQKLAIYHTISMATATTERCPTSQFLHTPFVWSEFFIPTALAN